MIQFGTGGWRAIIGDEFIKSNIQLLAKAICIKMKRENVADKGIVIGYDRRFLAKEAMCWIGQIFAQEGIHAKLINYSVPTPVTMFYVMSEELPYGLMVTASHNPAIYNGVKVFTAGGRDADEVQTGQIEEIMREIESEKIQIEEMEYETAKDQHLIEEIYPLNEYLDNIIKCVNMQAIREAHLKVALDPLYGVSELSLKTILLTARCQLETIHDNHDTLFGGQLPAPSEETVRSLQNFVVDKHCDIGLATDGDADRLGVIDDTGRFLHPNDILVLLYYYLLKYKGWHGAVVRNVATTHRLDRMAAQFGEICYEVPVGFKHISAKMQEVDAVLGGESSGGLTVRGHILGKDGVYAASLLVEMVALTGLKLSELMKQIEESYGSGHMEERDYRFTKEKKASIWGTIMEKRQLPEFPSRLPVDHVSYLDGSKVYFQNGGWIIARFSGTEPLLRIFCEMPEEKDAIMLCDCYETYLGLK